MFNFLNKFTQNDLITLREEVKKINNLESEIAVLTELEIKQRINKLIKQYQIDQNFENILHESFALTREASKRTLGLRHYDTQLMGGIVLHQGKIAEMKTGEGKTLVGTLPVVLNALSLKGVHVVTVNDYLAKRDQQWMSQLYRYLGLSVGLIQENMNSTQRRKNYAADITYVTNSEVAFDYLRDNMSTSVDELVLRDFNYCIIDEVDSILIDEARTPLIISGSLEAPIEKYVTADEVCNYLNSNVHYTVDEKAKNITLTGKGIEQIEKMLNVPSLYDQKNPWIPYINNAIKAKVLFVKDINYIVRDNEIVIIDEFTGRIMSDRRWGEGLHEAVEAKERVPIKKGSETLGSVTYQNFFLSYPKFAGMTGTAKTAEGEFEKIYKREVVVLPTTKPLIRNDLTDLVFKDEFTKWQSIAEYVQQCHLRGQPVLIGTTSIEKSELISSLLQDLKIKHRLLNAKPENIKLESEIVAQAGRIGAVTVATNMAGRGTDILLGGNPDFQTRQDILNLINTLKHDLFFYNKNFKIEKQILKVYESNFRKKIKTKKLITKILLAKYCELRLNLIKILNSTKYGHYLNTKKELKYKDFNYSFEIMNTYNQNQIELLIFNIIENGYLEISNFIDHYLFVNYGNYLKKNKLESQKEKLIVQKLGGLNVIGSERHDSRRIDNQLRGRAGRQGDPGMSRFFLSLDDNLIRIFGANQLKSLMEKAQFNSNRPLESEFLTQGLETAQKKVEDFYYDSRKRLFEYDEVTNTQRLAIYKERNALLKYKSVRPEMIAYGEDLIFSLARELKNTNIKNEKSQFYQLSKEISYLLGLTHLYLDYNEVKNLKLEEITKLLLSQLWITYDLKEAEFETITPGLIRLVEKTSLLKQIDSAWKSHLQKADILRETIGWRSYGQLDPLREYKNEGFKLFVETICEIKYNSIYDILKSKFP
jgi:preprotein translocase subunit SecA|uniref:Protein translocase subunit SecA n=1 Tax=Pseudopedinella elastica TaxID=35684 RepID=A0A516ZAC3_9STRA|nr:preprotein translocase subunit SecA [Pseudopedinella elastica]QDR24654.1 preprotein translocase subunit SecA [Pseudopedinella elastica]